MMKDIAPILIAALLVGCGDAVVDGLDSNAPADAGAHEPADAGASHDASVVETALRFAADERDGPAVHLESETLIEDELVLLVTVDGAPSVYGLGFRIEYDPAVLTFEGVEPGPAWSTSARPLLEAREARPGLLVGVITETKNARGFEGGASFPLAKARFRPSRDAIEGSSRVELIDRGTFVVRADGEEDQTLEVYGGALR